MMKRLSFKKFLNTMSVKASKVYQSDKGISGELRVFGRLHKLKCGGGVLVNIDVCRKPLRALPPIEIPTLPYIFN